MTLFISAVLIAAAFQSFCKLALLPRRWEFLTALLLMPLPFFFEGRIARTSLVGIDTALSGAETLESWCALVVIQELFSLMAGFSLLAEHESGERVKRWKYAVFLPSALLPAGVFYLQMLLFNEFPNFEFRTITVWLAVLLPAAGIAVSELTRLLRICSNNLNQYARKAHETGSIYAVDIADLQSRMDGLWEIAKKLLTEFTNIP